MGPSAGSTPSTGAALGVGSESPVILSEAKDLLEVEQILRFAQDDKASGLQNNLLAVVVLVHEHIVAVCRVVETHPVRDHE
jgi:hypothetical protein